MQEKLEKFYYFWGISEIRRRNVFIDYWQEYLFRAKVGQSNA